MRHLNKQSQYFASKVRALKEEFDRTIADLEDQFNDSVTTSQQEFEAILS